MESGNKKDLEWKFDVNGTCVRNFKELVGLIVISRIVPNLNSKLDDNERKFVEACYNGFGFEENYNWAQVIKEHKEKTNLCLTGNVYFKVLDEFKENPFEKLSEIMKGNNFTWDKIFDMIKKLDSYCYIDFTEDFFDFKDLAFELKEKLKSELGKVFNKFKEDWKKDKRDTVINNRKNWIKKVKLEENKIIKSWENLGQILTKVREHRDDQLFLYEEEYDIISDDYQLIRGNALDFFVYCCKYEYKKTFTDIESRKRILKLLLDLGFSFDYKWSKNNFQKLILSFNSQHWLSECILWFDDRDKEIDFSMLGFGFIYEYSYKIYPIDKKYDRGFSEEDMSCVLDKFKNEENGFCCAKNMQFFVYMMCNPCKDEFRVMKDKEKRKQFYLDLMDVFAKYVRSFSVWGDGDRDYYNQPLNYIRGFDIVCECEEKYLKEELVDCFMKEAKKQGVEKNPIKILSYRTGNIPNHKFCLLDLSIDPKSKGRHQITFTGCFIDIIKMIPKDIFENGAVKQKIKEVLETIYDVSLYDDKRKAFMLMLFIYENYDLCPNKKDIEQLFEKFIRNCSFGPSYSFCFYYFMFNIIFKNRNKFSLDEKKKMLGDLMKLVAERTGMWFFRDKASPKTISQLEEKTIKIQKVFRGFSYRKKNDKAIKLQAAVRKFLEKRRKLKKTIKIQKVFRGFSYRKKLNLKEKIKEKKVIKLQTAVRKFLAKKKLEKLKKTIKTQKVFRGFSYRKKLNLKEKIKEKKVIKLQTATRKFLARTKLKKLKLRKEKLKSFVQKKTETQEKIKKVILTNKLRRYLDQVKKLKLNAIKEKHLMIKIPRVAKQFLTRKRKMTKICKWLFAGFVISLVTFLFEMFVFDVAFLSIPSILTLLVAIILIARFLYIDHKFKIFFWKRKPPIENIINPSIQKENLIFNDKNNLITNQRIGTIPFNPNSITNPINITENNKDSNQKPLEEKNIEEGNIIDATENHPNQST